MKNLIFCIKLLVLLSQLLIVMILYLEKLYYRYFFIQIIPAFNITTFSKFLSVLFCVRAFDSLIYYSFFYEFVEGHLRAYYLQLRTGSTPEGPSRHKSHN